MFGYNLNSEGYPTSFGISGDYDYYLNGSEPFTGIDIQFYKKDLNTGDWDISPMSAENYYYGITQISKGQDASIPIYQYSINGATLWHSPYVSGDLYERISVDNGVSWGSILPLNVAENSDTYSEFIEIEIAHLATHPQRIDGSGSLVGGTDNNWRSTKEFLKAEAGDVITMHCYSNPIVSSVSFHNASKAFISSHKNSTYSNPYNASITAPTGTKFIRISFGADVFAGFTNSFKHRFGVATRHLRNEDLITSREVEDATIHSVLDPLNIEVSKLGLYKTDLQRTIALASTDKIILYGDSISSDNYPWYKEAMEALTGVAVYNGGYSAFTASMLATNVFMDRIFAYAPKVIIVLLGGNDNGAVGTVGTFSGAVSGEAVKTQTDLSLDYPTSGGNSYIQAVDHLMRKLKVYYYNIRARAGLTGGETDAQVDAAISAVLKPHIIFLSGIPQQRVNASDAYSLFANWKRKRDAVIECGIKNKIHVIDTLYSFDVDMSLEPFYVGPTDKTTNYGVFYMDGVHPNKFGFRRLSEIVISKSSILKYKI